jgi:hypothetical protein
MVIRQEQMEAFSASLRARYVVSLMERLRARFAEQFGATPEADLREWVETGLSKANQYGYSRENEVQLFIDLCAECGLDFDQKPWAAAIFEDGKLNSGEQLSRVDAHVVFALRWEK